MQIATHHIALTQHQQHLIQQVVLMAQEIMPMAAQPLLQQVAKHTTSPSQAHQIQLYASKKNQRQCFPIMQNLSTIIFDRNMESRTQPSKAHNKALHLTAKSAAPIVAMLLSSGELGR